jgi:cytoskeletal protein CcmA (bactofilin family)
MFRHSPTTAPPSAPDRASAESPGRRITDAAEASTTVIAPGILIRGELTGEDPVHLAGTLEGPSNVNALYCVREGGRVVGAITAPNIVIEGEVSGETLVAERVEIGASARVHANLRARTVAIAEGAFFDGQVSMEGRDGPLVTFSFKEKRKGRRPEDVDEPPSR